MGVSWIKGAQDGVIATAKHYVANNQEYNRTTVSSEVSKRALHEIYFPAFKAAVQQAHEGSVMASYNKINGTYASENAYLLNEVLKHDWGFKGFVVSDWGATHSTVAAANHGLDMEMPGGTYFGKPLLEAVQNGRVSKTRLNDMVRRILTAMYENGLFDENRPQGSLDHAKLARKIAEQSTVLLKNADHFLPLNQDQLDSIAVIGPYAKDPKVSGGGSAHITPTYAISPLEGIKNMVGDHVDVRFAQGIRLKNQLPAIDPSVLTPAGGSNGEHGLKAQYFNNMNFSGDPALTRVDQTVQFDWGNGSPADAVHNDHFSAVWTGTLTAPTTGTYTFGLTSDDGSRLYIDGQLVVDNWGDHAAQTKTGTIQLEAGQTYQIKMKYYENGGGAVAKLGWLMPDPSEETPIEKAADVARQSDVAIVVAADNRTEGADRDNLKLPYNQNQLIEAVEKANPNTIVVLNTGGPVLMNDWIDGAKGILEAWYSGQEGGAALANILFGKVNLSGRLPVTFQKHAGDASTASTYPGNGKVSEYTDGIYVGYRWFDKKNIQPQFAFGYGLSYTTFKYSHLRMPNQEGTINGVVPVTLDVTNTGDRKGATVVQLYVHDRKADVAMPVKELRAFKKVKLKPGQTKQVTFKLDKQDFAHYNVDRHGWVVDPGMFDVEIGKSSRKIVLKQGFDVEKGSFFED
ncbi:MAG TPA: glycoside hydrolase family 3 C-terminal domain-containing protein [Bacillales bacterium]|nr:glycoside hydrolase family 3 C-terminal domain-containing protein [Bacillales bacterium]